MKESKPTERELNQAMGGKGARIQVSAPEDRTWNGILFASKREMCVFQQFEAMWRLGSIRNLRRQITYPLHVVTPTGFKVKITSYRADIVCEDLQGRTCVYDPKGMKTDRYKLIKKWFEAEYGLRIVEL